MNTFIITAGGIGKRMGGHLPKQFLLVKEKPILLYTLERFYEADPFSEIFITLPEDWVDYWNELLNKHTCSIPHTIITGGIERYDSIKNALNVSTGTIISVHDGVRPCVSIETIHNCINSAKENGSGVPYLPVKESLRKMQHQTSEAVNRQEYVLVQTPQSFSVSILKKAYELPFHEGITDDASLVEEAGFQIHLVKGNEENIKITTPMDLELVNVLL
jgi:2-C-methyl-D-erythritol 4-phosphate cytidylyltransferase